MRNAGEYLKIGVLSAPPSARARHRGWVGWALLAAGLLAAVLAAAAAPAVAATGPQVTFTPLTPLPDKLAVGESALIGVRVQSSEPFAMAIALSDAYYPGRGVRFDGSPAQSNATKADLYLTISGRESTAHLGAVEGWPAAGYAWPAGVAPLSVSVGARFAGGYVASQRFPFAVAVS